MPPAAGVVERNVRIQLAGVVVAGIQRAKQGEVIEGRLGLSWGRGLRTWWREALYSDMFLAPLLEDIGCAKADAVQPDLQEAEIEWGEA